MKIVIACDKFKGSLTSSEANESISCGFFDYFEREKVSPFVKRPEISSLIMADGGEGTLEIFAANKKPGGGEVEEIILSVKDPLLRDISAKYLMCGRRAYIEMAKASGLALLNPSEYDPLRASTYGFGQMIADAIERGAEEIVCGIGGSATNDGGAGMLAALGFELVGRSGFSVEPGGVGLLDLIEIRCSPASRSLASIKFITACDVNNPLLGAEGATRVYSAQKGAGEREMAILERALENFSGVVCEFAGEDFRGHPGAGAAGGTGFAMLSLLGAELRPGWQVMAEAAGLEERTSSCDLVVTGEGSLDKQSLHGKVASGVADTAGRHNKPLWIFCGVNRLAPEEAELLGKSVKVFSLEEIAPDPQTSLKEAKGLLRKISAQAATFLKEIESNLQNQ